MKIIKPVLQVLLFQLCVLAVMAVLIFLPFIGPVHFIWPEPIRQEEVAEVLIAPELTASDEDRDFLLSVIGSAWRKPLFSDRNKPPYDSLYSIQDTIEIKLKEEGKSYKLLLYNQKDFSIFRGETEYKLALVREENGQSKMWALPYNACYELIGWYHDRSMSVNG